jgi:UDP-N-acetylglucosamine:LPS N-acetylglucosamine transferase
MSALVMATRLNAERAEKILLSWKEGSRGFSDSWRRKTEVVGNPVRPGLLKGEAAKARKDFGYPRSFR